LTILVTAHNATVRVETDRQVMVMGGGLGTAIRFYVLAFVSSWAVWGTAIVWASLEDWEPLIIIAGAYGPLLAAVVMAKRAGIARSWIRQVIGLRRRVRWVLIGSVALPLVIALVHVTAYRTLIGSVALSSDPPWYWAAAAAPVNVWLVFWLGSALEEFGWQGVAVPALTERFHPLVAAAVHGVVWGTWHLPLLLVDSWTGGDQSIAVLYGITVTLSPIMIWLTRSAVGGVMPAVFLHAATNHYTDLFTDETTLFDPPLLQRFDAVKVAIYGVIALVVVAATRGRLRSTGSAG